MKPICLFFQVHQPIRLRTYRFFDIGQNHDYYDDFLNKITINKVGESCYIPMNNMLMRLIEKYGDNVKISLSISGTTIEQMTWFAPHVLDSFKRLVETGNVELLTQPYNFSFAAIYDKELFSCQVQKEDQMLVDTFHVKPKAFKNTQLLFNNNLSDTIYKLGYDTVIIEGAKHVLGWRPAENVYCSSSNPRLKLLTRTSGLCDDVSFRFDNREWSEWPLTAEKFFGWLQQSISRGNCLTLALEYETFGYNYKESTGIFDFFNDFIERIIADPNLFMATPSEITKLITPAAQLDVPYNMTWADEEKDTSAWLGNELQSEAFKQLYSLTEAVKKCNDDEIRKDFLFLQSVDNLLYMCTKLFVQDTIRNLNSPYSSPYNAFINYMNVVSDMKERIEAHNIEHADNEVNSNDGEKDKNEFVISWKNIVTLNETCMKKVLKNISDDSVLYIVNSISGKDKKNILAQLSLTRQNKIIALSKSANVETSNVNKYRLEIEKAIYNVINA